MTQATNATLKLMELAIVWTAALSCLEMICKVSLAKLNIFHDDSPVHLSTHKSSNTDNFGNHDEIIQENKDFT